MKKSSIIALLAISSVSTAMACSKDGREGIFPDNKLSIPVKPFHTYNTGEEGFYKVIEKTEKVYAPVLAAMGETLKVYPKWDDGTVNAYAKLVGTTAEVYMFGGLARHELVTADAFQMVICHELGHHLGGVPKTSEPWASNEGQADYFATLKCAREMWKSEDNQAAIAGLEVPAMVQAACQKGFSSANDVAICIRGTMAGKSLADTLSTLGGSFWPSRSTTTIDPSKFPKFETPDPKVVSKTDNEHPAAQCRLDTYFAGAVCPISKDVPVSGTDATQGTCDQTRGETFGVRPLCWYKPGSSLR